jgi:hypothetical protein
LEDPDEPRFRRVDFFTLPERAKEAKKRFLQQFVRVRRLAPANQQIPVKAGGMLGVKPGGDLSRIVTCTGSRLRVQHQGDGCAIVYSYHSHLKRRSF